MPVTLIKGPIGAGKTSSFLDIIKKTFSSRSGVFIVPTEATAAEIRRRLLKEKAAIIGDIVIPWSKFIRLLAEPIKPLLSPFQTAIFIHKILTNQRLKYFKGGWHSIGIARQFAETILTLKRNGIDPDRLSRLLDTRGGIKENDLLTVFNHYEDERKKHDLFDEGDLLNISLMRIREKKASFLKDMNTIIMDEFHSFSPGQISIIENIKRADNDCDILISFPTTSDEKSLYRGYLEKGLKAIAAVSDKVKAVKAPAGHGPNTEILTARSTLQEARSVIHAMMESLNECRLSREDIVLSSRFTGNFFKDLLDECSSMNFFRLPPASGDAFESPLLHRLLAPVSVMQWPDEAPIAEYIKLCADIVRSGNPIDAWCGALGPADTKRSDVARSLSSIFKLQEALKNLETISHLLELNITSRETFLRLLKDEIRRGSNMTPCERALPVRYVPFDSGLSFPAKHVIIPRMSEGEIPRAQSEKLFFAEADRLSPKPDETIDSIFATAEDSLAADAYLFDTFRGKCTERLTFIYPIIDESGSETSKSSFLDAYPDPTPLPAICANPEAATSPGWSERLAHIENVENERAEGIPNHPSYHGILDSDDAKVIVRRRFTDEKLSATGLEKYATCPFVYFVEKVLGLKPKEEEMPELLPKDRGTILHAILERFYRDHLDSFKSLALKQNFREQISATVEKLIDEVLDEHARLFAGVAPGLKPMQRQTIKTMSMQVIEMEISQARTLGKPLFPFRCEWRFGEKDIPDLDIPLENDSPAKIRGCIDRIDLDEKKRSFLIIDYKTGTGVKSMKQDILKGMKLQLPLYVEAVRRLLLPNADPLGGLLIDVLNAEKRHGFVKKQFNGVHFDVGRAHSAMSDDDWNRSITAAVSACATYAAAIRAGRFDVKPKDGCPPYCEYADICRHSGKCSD